MRLLWATDIHLDHVLSRQGGVKKLDAFFHLARTHQCRALVVTGDIGESRTVRVHMENVAREMAPWPVYYVAGNHDFYGSTIKAVRAELSEHDGLHGKPLYLHGRAEPVMLTPKTALIGADGWYDGGYGGWEASTIRLSDFSAIQDLTYLSPSRRQAMFNELARDSAWYVKRLAKLAAEQGAVELIVATHVPPFRECSRAPDGTLSDKDWLPAMSSKIMGDALKRVCKENPSIERVICLSGHTHTGHQHFESDQLAALVGWSDYGRPEVSLRALDVR